MFRDSYLSINHKPLQHFHLLVLFCTSLPELFGSVEATNPVTGLPRNDYGLKEITQRNIQLYNRYRKRIHSLENGSSIFQRFEGEMKKNRESLPIAEFR